MRALSIASTGMLAQQLNVEVISNNIANLNTTGFKRQRAEFQDLLYQNIERVGAQTANTGSVSANGIQVGLGVKAGSVYRITEQGDLAVTENTLDLAIQGRGFLQVQLPTGEIAYTRAGSLALDPNGQLVTADGFPIEPVIAIPQDATDVSINAEGVVEASIAGQVNPQQVGQIQLATFFNEGGLEAIGGNNFLESAASGPPTVGAPGQLGFGSILQGFVETSNVNAVQEISSLITAQRAYEMNSRVISTADEMMSAVSNLR